MRRVGWFLVAGSVGFLTDAGMLALLLKITPLGPLPARIFAILFALSVTWAINRNRTFGKSRHGLVTEGARYGGVGLLSALINYAIYVAILLIVPSTHPVAAVAFASLGAMAFSWAGYSRFVFQK